MAAAAPGVQPRASVVKTCKYNTYETCSTYVTCSIHKLVEGEVDDSSAVGVKSTIGSGGGLQEQAGPDVFIQGEAAAVVRVKLQA